MTKNGIHKFIDNCIQSIQLMVQRIPFPDVSLDIGNYKVIISELHFPVIEVGPYDFDLTQTESTVWISGIDMTVTMRFRLQGQSFPYTSLDTDSTVYLRNMSLNVKCSLNSSKQCEDHLQFTINDLFVDYNKLDWQLHDGGWIISALLPLFDTAVRKVISKAMAAAFQHQVNHYTYGWGGAVSLKPKIEQADTLLTVDQRIVDITINNSFIHLKAGGLDEYYRQKYGQMLSKLQNNYSNDDLNYGFDKVTFQQLFEHVFGFADMEVVNLGLFGRFQYNNKQYEQLFRINSRVIEAKNGFGDKIQQIEIRFVCGDNAIDDLIPPYIIFNAPFAASCGVIYRPNEQVVVVTARLK